MHAYSGIRLSLCAILLLAIGTGLAFAQGQKVTRENREATEGERDNPQERARWFLRGRTVDGRPAPALLHKAYQQKLSKRRSQATARAFSTQSDGEATATSPSFSVNP